MAKHIILLLTPVYILLVFCSCDSIPTSNVDENGIINVNFGTKKFNEPFPFEGEKPQWIKDMVTDYLSWFWTNNDTLEYDRHFEISFNEDAVRSKSRMNVFCYIDPTIGKYVETQINGKKVTETNPLVIDASQDAIELSLHTKIHPEFGEGNINGFIVAIPENIDDINDNAIQEEGYPIVTWYATQEIGWPLLLWTVLLLLLFAIIAAVVYAAWHLLLLLAGLFSAASFTLPSITLPRKSFTSHKEHKQHKKQEKEEKKRQRNGRQITPSQGIYIMNKIAEWLEKHGGDFNRLPKYWQGVMDRYYEHNTFPMPKDGVRLGENDTFRWIPDDSKRIKKDYDDVNYNPKQYTLKQMMKQYGRNYIEFKKQLPDFTPFALDSIEVEIELQPIDYGAKYIRTTWQNEAKKILKDRMHYSSIREMQAKYLEANQLTMHEHVDGKTILLVNTPIHISIPHEGGSALVSFLCRPNIPTYDECKKELGRLGIRL